MNLSIVYRKAHNLFHPIIGEIWCLHRVVDVRSKFPSNRDLEVTPEYLEQLLLQYKSLGYRFVSIDDVLQYPRYGFSKRRWVNISFDDGFSDVYDNAYPIFRKYSIPFTIYLTVGMPEGTADLWWMQLESLVDGDVPSFERLVETAYKNPKLMSETMHEMTHSTTDGGVTAKFSLTWEQISEMVASGLCTIGSHTVSHPGLTRLTSEKVEEELLSSKSMIENKIPGQIVRHFSYPHSMCNVDVEAAVKKAGYESAVLGYGGKIRKGDNVFRLHRNNIVQK